MSFKFRMQAEGGRFAPDAFAGDIGRRITVRGVAREQEAIVLGAEVAPDGTSVELTVDADLSDIVPQPPVKPGDFSLPEIRPTWTALY